ncbi:hypothetical protein BU25DRAFT_488684 [Macroventuria anomochaeta]|uniref:Uncharacterized protein n=1 Tax=Macroventuria anomochaeta TaxID=301207 RepID=A0ACB6SBD6_9PLEO|nr:uncharacterized protein BU25DRAFT_488684 [Macroventuria anomochaeta]KAF2631288.1 hypothetical protein BU25DRAFT_488684 [Macroventuria anomochaeta]
MPLRRSNRRKINEPAPESTQDAPATPAYSKRQRISTRPFEQGVNPITPPSTARCPSLRPPASQATEAEEALFVHEDSEIRGAEDDDNDAGGGDKGDPNPEEVENDAEVLAEVDNGPVEESAAAFSEPEHETVATLRYRATFSDIEKNPIHSAADAHPDYKVDNLTMTGLWLWVDEVIESQTGCRLNVGVASLVAELWYGRGANRRDRPQKRLRQGSVQDIYDLKDLAKSIDLDTSEKLTIDFNLYLIGDLIPASQLASQLPQRSSQPRARTATAIQEEGLEGVVAAQLMGAGATLAIKDTWRCEKKECSNWLWCCWRPRTGLPDEQHYPVNPNIIAMWAKSVEQRQCTTVQEPNDCVKSAIMRARERSEVDKVRKQQQQSTGDGVLEEVRELQKSVLMAQLSQLNSGLVAQSTPAGWQPFEYEFWAEILAHTDNFFAYFREKWDVSGAQELIDEVEQKVVKDGHIDINMLMDKSSENGVSMELWVDHFDLRPGVLLQLWRHALRWRKTYNGLSGDDFEKIATARRQQQEHLNCRSPLSDI